MPALPEVGSRIVLSLVRAPVTPAASIIGFAMRSSGEPVGFWPSSLAQRWTPGFGLKLGRPTSGVFPIASRMSSKRTDRLSQEARVRRLEPDSLLIATSQRTSVRNLKDA